MSIESLPDSRETTSAFPTQAVGAGALSGQVHCEQILGYSSSSEIKRDIQYRQWGNILTEQGFDLDNVPYSQHHEFVRATYAIISEPIRGAHSAAVIAKKPTLPPIALAERLITRRIDAFYGDPSLEKRGSDAIIEGRIQKQRSVIRPIVAKGKTLFTEIIATDGFMQRLDKDGRHLAAEAMQDLLTIYGLAIIDISKAQRQRNVENKLGFRTSSPPHSFK